MSDPWPTLRRLMGETWTVNSTAYLAYVAETIASEMPQKPGQHLVAGMWEDGIVRFVFAGRFEAPTQYDAHFITRRALDLLPVGFMAEFSHRRRQ